MQRVSPTAHVGFVQLPVCVLQSATVAHVGPSGSQPFRSGLQISGCPLLQRSSPTPHVGVWQVAVAA
jgi:hypothetical protein